MHEAKKRLGKATRAARLNKELTQEQLAEKVGVQPRMILEIENGRVNPQFDNLYQIMLLLDIPPNDIFNADRAPSTAVDKFVLELSAFTEQEQLLALAAAQAVLEQLRKNRDDGEPPTVSV